MKLWSWLSALVLSLAVPVAQPGLAGVVLEGTVHCPSEHPKVVFVEAGNVVSPPPPSAPAVLDQRGLEFIPRVLPVMVGTRVAFINSDPVLHNVFSASKTKLFNLGTYATGVTRYVTFDRPGVVEVLCNVHHEMIAYIVVLPGNLFTITDDAGRYRLEGLPAGEARATFWCEVHGVHRRKLKLDPSQPNRLDLDDTAEPSERDLVFDR